MGQTADELRGQIQDQRASISRDLAAIEDRVVPGRVLDRRKARARHSVQSLRDRVMGTVQSTTHSALDAASSAKDATTGQAHGLVEATGALPDKALGQVQGAPLLAGGVAFGAGLLLATAFPATRREQQLVAGHEGEIRHVVEEAKSQAGELAQGAAEHLRPQAEAAAQDLKEKVAGAAETVKEEAASTKDETVGRASEAAGEVKDTATGG